MYIPPDRTRDIEYIEAHCRSVHAILETASAVDEIVVLGDFNLPSISWISSDRGFLYPDTNHSQFHPGAVTLLDSYSTATLQQINSVTNENDRYLDLCFVSDLDSSTSVVMAPCPLVKMVAHHPPLLVTIKHSLVHDSINSSATFSYDFHKADHRSIAELFTTLDWENVLDLNNIESAAQTFSAILAYAIDRHVPKKSQEHKTGPPWQTTSLRRLKTFKKAALRRFTKHRTVPLRIAYVRLVHKYKYASQRCFS